MRRQRRFYYFYCTKYFKTNLNGRECALMWPCYYLNLRLSIPHEGILIRIPMAHGDRVGWFWSRQILLDLVWIFMKEMFVSECSQVLYFLKQTRHYDAVECCGIRRVQKYFDSQR